MSQRDDTKKIERAVKRGAEWLDKTVPGWFRKVKATTLELASPELCVLGQLSNALAPGADFSVVVDPNYVRSITQFSDGCAVNLRPLGQTYTQAVKRGFDVPELRTLSTNEGYNLLNDLWRAEIRKRRGRSGTDTRPRRAPVSA